jgi:hypothetical protein
MSSSSSSLISTSDLPLFKFVRGGSHREVAGFVGNVIETRNNNNGHVRNDLFNIVQGLAQRVVPHTCAHNAYTLDCNPLSHEFVKHHAHVHDRNLLAWECLGMMVPDNNGQKKVALKTGEKLFVVGVDGRLIGDFLDVNMDRVLESKHFDNVGDALTWMHAFTWEKIRSNVESGSHFVLENTVGCLALVRDSPNKLFKRGGRRQINVIGALVFDIRPIIIPGKVFTVSSVVDTISKEFGVFSLEKTFYYLLCRSRNARGDHLVEELSHRRWYYYNTLAMF